VLHIGIFGCTGRLLAFVTQLVNVLVHNLTFPQKFHSLGRCNPCRPRKFHAVGFGEVQLLLSLERLLTVGLTVG
jgi:hypothetical protein